MEITLIETDFCDFLDRYTVYAVQLAIYYEDSIERLITADAPVRAILQEELNIMFYGEIGYAGTDWHIPSPDADEELIHEFLRKHHVM